MAGEDGPPPARHQVRVRRAASYILQRSRASQQPYDNNQAACGTSLELLEADIKEEEDMVP